MKTHLDDSGRVLFAWLTVLFLSLFLASASPCRAEEGAVLFEDDFESGSLASEGNSGANKTGQKVNVILLRTLRP